VHLIGHLQSNKAQRAVELFDGIDSVDSLRLAERLNEAAGKLNKRLPVLIEVKLSPEETKAGLDPESAEAAQLLERLPELASANARADDDCAPGRDGSRNARLFPQPARVARALGRGLSAAFARRALDGHERRFCAGH
jgi:D-serine deaminase-like pyridoxal phosphate-dependent protein